MFAKGYLCHSSSYYKTITVSVGFREENNLREKAFREFINHVYVFKGQQSKEQNDNLFLPPDAFPFNQSPPVGPTESQEHLQKSPTS